MVCEGNVISRANRLIQEIICILGPSTAKHGDLCWQTRFEFVIHISLFTLYSYWIFCIGQSLITEKMDDERDFRARTGKPKLQQSHIMKKEGESLSVIGNHVFLASFQLYTIISLVHVWRGYSVDCGGILPTQHMVPWPHFKLIWLIVGSININLWSGFVTLSPCRTLQIVKQTQKDETCQLNKLSTPFPAGGFPPDPHAILLFPHSCLVTPCTQIP